ncbi:hypothetical protein BV25DRAFT_68384 [Artomyces pyxidatus]|uniref:Uncharacterized protein n=1 Tax=Artomyces pyxidatus TaxID=48021 RepID=A0ACB8TKJ1_9AGAM|nr:hypothetical protein BV25DRAFT_68384 [Artomyces pyxidatus]
MYRRGAGVLSAHLRMAHSHLMGPCGFQSRALHVRATPETDDCAIPLGPTWSVDELLSSYTTPKISPSTLTHLHRLSALLPPEEGTPEHETLTRELEGLVQLVEAVKMAQFGQDKAGAHLGAKSDGRIWPENTGIDLAECAATGDREDALHQQQLLSHATRTMDGLYVVDSDRRSRSKSLQSDC